MDVPSIAKAGAELADKERRTNIQFINSLEDRRGADIVLSTGALQYLVISIGKKCDVLPFENWFQEMDSAVTIIEEALNSDLK